MDEQLHLYVGSTRIVPRVLSPSLHHLCHDFLTRAYNWYIYNVCY